MSDKVSLTETAWKAHLQGESSTARRVLANEIEILVANSDQSTRDSCSYEPLETKSFGR